MPCYVFMDSEDPVFQCQLPRKEQSVACFGFKAINNPCLKCIWVHAFMYLSLCFHIFVFMHSWSFCFQIHKLLINFVTLLPIIVCKFVSVVIKYCSKITSFEIHFVYFKRYVSYFSEFVNKHFHRAFNKWEFCSLFSNVANDFIERT